MDSPHNLTMLACIYTRRSTRIFWYNFEALRLHLTWTIAKKRKLRNKIFFKQKKKKQKSITKIFYNKNKPIYNNIQVWFNGFPHLPYTNKPRGSRMGKGKGATKLYYFKSYSNHPLIILNNCTAKQINLIFYKLKQHIPGTSISFYYPLTLKYSKWN